MREIKFRVWDIQEKKFVFPSIICNIIYELHVNKETDVLEHFTLSQFTGAKDQAGKEIYEGDIIRLEYHAGLPSTEGIELVKILRVEYFSNHTHYSAISKDGGSYSVNFGGSAVKSFKVIGNIYENSELLNS